jgi:hypothetical protein
MWLATRRRQTRQPFYEVTSDCSLTGTGCSQLEETYMKHLSKIQRFSTKKTETEMKTVSGKIAGSASLLALAVSAAMLPSAANAADYCYNSIEGGVDCSFTTMEQCQATAAGPSGTCTQVLNWGAASGSGHSYAYYPQAHPPKHVTRRSDVASDHQPAQ